MSQNEAIEKYVSKAGRVFYVISLDHKKDDAIKLANYFFKTSRKKLQCKAGFVYKDELYFKYPHKNAAAVWVVWKSVAGI